MPGVYNGSECPIVVADMVKTFAIRRIILRKRMLGTINIYRSSFPSLVNCGVIESMFITAMFISTALNRAQPDDVTYKVLAFETMSGSD